MPIALVTGSSRGIGFELTRQLAQWAGRCWQRAEIRRSAKDLNALAEMSSGKIEVFALDVADKASIADFAKHLGARPIDLLMCNAGVSGPKPPLLTGTKGERNSGLR